MTPALFVPSSRVPQHVWAFAVLYFAASLAHFSHNAEYIAFYPNMRKGLTREQVYLVWLAITGVGAIGFAALRLRWTIVGAAFLLAYGAMGLDGLGHYWLALCSEHSIAANITIWAEAVTGVVLAVSCGAFIARVVRGVSR
ncbi:hypothetical protein [Ramlibacter sp. WS9]|uniref:hypothetical protein n=1 Tax=Ramlibacter sp. WS9 TaxID=1882741 RepID=UPI001142C6B3|nr:hypothetical protein [Ramlibacter sp. WS9]ROZ63891.1 hypothetical protein EEB15_29355 [Ramlibacter sp. WS9]